MNKSIELFDHDVTIDSREIAELTGKKHSHVSRDIKKQLKELDINESKFGSVYFDAKNEKRNCFRLDYDQTMILVSGYSIPLRAKIIKRWTELEQQNKPALPQSFSEALQLAADQAKQLELQAPKVEFFDTVTKLDSWLTFKDVANMLNIPNLGRNNLTKKLRELKYINDFNKPYQKYIDQKLFKVIETLKGKNVYTSTVVSQKGLDKLSKILKEK